MKTGNTHKKATQDIVIGEIYEEESTGRVFMALVKDDFSVYDSTGWCYAPNNLKKVS